MSKFSVLVILVSCLILQQSCTLVGVRRVKVVHQKEQNAPSNIFDRSFTQVKIRYAKSNGKNLVFDVMLENKKIKYEEKSYLVKGVEERSLDKDKKGRLKSYFIGPAWAVAGSGADEYLISLGLSTVMSLGVALVIAAGDWLSLPIRVIDSDFEETRRDVKKLGSETSQEKISDTLSVLIFKKRYKVKNDRIEVADNMFAKVCGDYRIATLKIEYEYEGKESQHYQKVSSIFEKDVYDGLILSQCK